MSQENLPKVFLDTDVAFDIISKRAPHFSSSVLLLQRAAEGKAILQISECSLANLFYLSFDIYKLKDAASRLSDFILVCELISSGRDSALSALDSDFKDKEDALQYFSALRASSDYFVTRNVKDYKHKRSSLPVFTPSEFIKKTD